jgi:hypothetical protein
MVISLKKLKEWFQFLLLFVLFTLLMYQLFQFLSPLFEPDFMYKEPSGGAIKVFAHEQKHAGQSLPEEIAERLFLFYRIGE